MPDWMAHIGMILYGALFVAGIWFLGLVAWQAVRALAKEIDGRPHGLLVSPAQPDEDPGGTNIVPEFLSDWLGQCLLIVAALFYATVVYGPIVVFCLLLPIWLAWQGYWLASAGLGILAWGFVFTLRERKQLRVLKQLRKPRQ